MTGKFQLDPDPTPKASLVDPDGFDVSEQKFAASLEQNPASAHFVPESAEPTLRLESNDIAEQAQEPEECAPATTGESLFEEPDAWRREVVARVSQYRGKRPRMPRYPSLQLKFEPQGPPVREESQLSTSAQASRGQLAIRMDAIPEPIVDFTQQAAVPPQESPAKILEFPRSSFVPPMVVDELAEPVFDRPRIMEVPEVLPPPPALGGILIDPPEQLVDDRRPGVELPLQSAPLSRRIAAGSVDAALVGAAFAGFAYIFFRTSQIVPPLQPAAVVAALVFAGFWATYQYLLLVHAGSTPGLKLLGLRLSRFDGSPVPRRLRRWRVLASLLSGLSLALGYAWCFLDEDQLCWHDRITHTYMAPKAGQTAPGPQD